MRETGSLERGSPLRLGGLIPFLGGTTRQSLVPCRRGRTKLLSAWILPYSHKETAMEAKKRACPVCQGEEELVAIEPERFFRPP